MSKLFFEMTETEAQLQNILNSLEYAQYQMSTGINGYGNGTMTREEHQETERSVLSSLGVAMSGIQSSLVLPAGSYPLSDLSWSYPHCPDSTTK